MKKLHFFLLIGAFSMLMASCMKEDEEQKTLKSYSTFKVNPPAFTTDSKSYLDFTQALSRILYQEGDIVYINGVQFALRKEGQGESTIWYADRTDGGGDIEDYSFYCCHANGTVSNYNTPDYTVDLGSSTSGIVLAGTTDNNVLTLYPLCAVLVFKPNNINDYNSIRVGFDGSKVPRTFTVAATESEIRSVSSFMNKANSSISGTMWTMKQVGDYFYLAVPIYGDMSTKLYIEYTLGDNTVVQRVTKGQVSMSAGIVYLLPSEDMSDYAFDSNGAGRKFFSVSSSQQVKFSAGNLQCVPNLDSRVWRFAPHQYDRLNTNTQIGVNCTTFVDLLGYGTSGTQVGNLTYMFQPFGTSGTFFSYDLVGNNANADWGVANSGAITYGESISNRSWRTLTKDEWEYLLSRNNGNLKGGATVHGISGLVLLPDVWSNPIVRSFSNGNAFNSNVYTDEEWDKMEKAGAIFLPVCGFRNGTTVNSRDLMGVYWTSTYNYALFFSGMSQGTNSRNTSHGCSIRLVTDKLNNEN